MKKDVFTEKTLTEEIIFKTIYNELNYQTYESESIIPLIDGMNNPLCHWLISGCASLIRVDDNIRTFPVTDITSFGLAGGAFFHKHYAIVTDIDSVISSQYVSDLRTIISDQKGWGDLMTLQNEKVDKYISYYDNMSGREAYSEICFLLSIIMKLPEHIRMKLKLSKFIIQRTLISRSMTLQILSKLKESFHIHVFNGYLLSIRHLPTNKFW